ncbi:hypothetical protein BDA96_02G285500 [Sorghum bicolor]|uniref:Uncharacterized protein n=1 Tax=Sorghum bicolor TaxID=4558 RepID=A0A921RQ95_SORBI|nr:zinc finger A20 and AN1 domain-containing stress-associated protein 9-like [Sorghum bicolor]KAG0544553.1 hypothetical protein BDA96_02G285500 [Sorghum bicolor]|eukprot:XP_021309246.1 zinc finger A20 and AN1 domain-containing stress-associated protein 9-like [Sorghum bicolor]
MNRTRFPPSSPAAHGAGQTPLAAAAPERQPRAGSRKSVPESMTRVEARAPVGVLEVNRYAEKHACSFDFKTAAREKIARNNPLVVAAKINKI